MNMKKDKTHLIFNKAYYTMIYIMAIIMVVLLGVQRMSALMSERPPSLGWGMPRGRE